MRTHPFTWVPINIHKKVFIILFITTIAVMVGLQVLDVPLKTEAAPSGIVSFEFAGSQEKAKQILHSWSSAARISAGLSLGLDYLFLLAYAGTIGLGCVLAAHKLSQKQYVLASVGVPVAWGQLGAALLDAVENYGLIQELLGAETELWPIVTFWCAISKFTIVAVGLAYIIVSACLIAIVRPRSS